MSNAKSANRFNRYMQLLEQLIALLYSFCKRNVFSL